MVRSESKWLKWIVLLVGCYVNMFVYATLFTLASLLNEMLDKFQETLSRTATVQAIFSGVGLSAGIFTGMLLSRFGIMKITLIGGIMASLGFILSFLATSIVHLYLCIGVLAGIGSSVLIISSVTTVKEAFSDSQMQLALAIQNTWVSVGGAVTPYLYDYLVKEYGLKGTFLLMSGIYLNGIPAAILFSVPKNSNKLTVNNNTDTPTSEKCFAACRMDRLKTTVLKTIRPQFTFTVMANAIIIASLTGLYSIILDILKWKEFSSEEALLAFPISHGLGIVARLLPGIVKQIKGVNSFIFPIVFSLCGACGQLFVIFSSGRFFVLIGCALFGISMAGVISATNIVVVQLLDQEQTATGFGFMYSSIGILAMIYGPTYGAIKDVFLSYDVVLFTAFAFQLFGATLFLVAIYAGKLQARGTSYTLKGSKQFHSKD